jgi:hypothetical protein
MWRAGSFALALSAAAGCASGGLSELGGGIEMGVRRGSAWTTLTVKLPYVLGPSTSLRLDKGRVTGAINGRGVSITIEPDGAHGTGPYGPVSLDIYDGEDAMVIEGLWNGSRVHFRVTESSFRGTIAVWTGGSLGAVASCQYVLDSLAPDGSWLGSSTCSSLPEDTRIEVPVAIRDWLTRNELSVIILALLSSPPTTIMEQRHVL